MCFYERIDYACGDWKWGNMKERCPRQPRLGETCGAKLAAIESVTRTEQECRVCKELGTKRRRLQKELDRISRWSKPDTEFPSSLAKARRAASALEEAIQDITHKRVSVMMRVNNMPRETRFIFLGGGYYGPGRNSEVMVPRKTSDIQQHRH